MYNIARNKETFLQSIKNDGSFLYLPNFSTDDEIIIDTITNQVHIFFLYKFSRSNFFCRYFFLRKN